MSAGLAWGIVGLGNYGGRWVLATDASVAVCSDVLYAAALCYSRMLTLAAATTIGRPLLYHSMNK